MITIQTFAEETLPSVTICGSSMQGDREYQQDCMHYQRCGGGVLAMVCDGMGGMAGGELASQTAVEVMREKIKGLMTDEDIPQFFREAAVEMDQEVSALTDDFGAKLHAGTTVTAVYVKGKRLYWMSVGDSKLYLFRGGELEEATQSHNYQWLRERNGGMDDGLEEKGEALVSFIGMGGIRYMDCSEEHFLLQPGDCMLLCSDGLYKALSKEAICRTIALCHEKFANTADALIDMVSQYGRRPLDNCTVLLLKYVEEEDHERTEKM